MPHYLYECKSCSVIRDARRPVDLRDEELACLECDGPMERVFTPTAMILTPEHFRHMQSDFLPDREDKKGWENRTSNSGYRPSEPARESLHEHLDREFWQP